MAKIEEAVLVQNVRTVAALDQMTSQVTAIHSSKQESLTIGQRAQNDIESVLTQTIHKDDNAMTDQLRITTRIPLTACSVACKCQCHIRIQTQTPKWLSAVIGTLFYSSAYTPSPDIRQCNVKTCLRAQPSSSSRLTYYFPSWVMRKAVVYSTWSNLNGENSCWMIKMPKEISASDICWQLIRLGNVKGIQRLLKSRLISPYDIRPDGVSLLHVGREN